MNAWKMTAIAFLVTSLFYIVLGTIFIMRPRAETRYTFQHDEQGGWLCETYSGRVWYVAPATGGEFREIPRN